jgi:hypothetical protein
MKHFVTNPAQKRQRCAYHKFAQLGRGISVSRDPVTRSRRLPSDLIAGTAFPDEADELINSATTYIRTDDAHQASANGRYAR